MARRTLAPIAPTAAVRSTQTGSCPPGALPPPALTTVGTVSDSGVLGASAASGVMSGTAISASVARGDADGDASSTGAVKAESVVPPEEPAGVVVGVLDGAEVGVGVGDGEGEGEGEGVMTEMICVGQDALLIQSAPAVALTPA